jgi:hypothetical protein
MLRRGDFYIAGRVRYVYAEKMQSFCFVSGLDENS